MVRAWPFNVENLLNCRFLEPRKVRKGKKQLSVRFGEELFPGAGELGDESTAPVGTDRTTDTMFESPVGLPLDDDDGDGAIFF